MKRIVGMIMSDDKYMESAKELVDKLIKENNESIENIYCAYCRREKITNKTIYRVIRSCDNVRGNRFHDVYIFGNVNRKIYSIINVGVIPHEKDDLNSYSYEDHIRFIDGGIIDAIKN